jgi:hypothetical protein
MFTALLVHEISVSNEAAFTSDDRYGNPVFAYEITTEQARVEPVGSQEDLVDRDTRITRFRLFLGPSTAVNGKSTFTWDGRSFRVDGEPRAFYGAAALHHFECDASEILG